ncbi:MAG TPA: tetratricopeptide repeat protein [Polyangia bacterium]
MSANGDSRLAKLRAFAEARPQDPFPRYALALEHRNAGDHAEAARVFTALMADHPDYVPTYLHAGHALTAAGNPDEAKVVWRRGLEVAQSKGDHHAAGELQGVLGG